MTQIQSKTVDYLALDLGAESGRGFWAGSMASG